MRGKIVDYHDSAIVGAEVKFVGSNTTETVSSDPLFFANRIGNGARAVRGLGGRRNRNWETFDCLILLILLILFQRSAPKHQRLTALFPPFSSLNGLFNHAEIKNNQTNSNK